ncbi:ABC transporter ATP-binding protein [Exiguobacterium sp. s142]|uniref:ABC transporter ATP-binding protein n=1 Tax=Exiguobacterium sp. s142 TaxID=2751222 RepID=UPI001BECB7B1|nr:ABC transporter ATP-binding protein [Exiguobacterium sp. s142]
MGFLNSLGYSLRIIFQLNKWPTLFIFVIKIIEGFLPVLTLLIVQKLINAVQEVLINQEESMRTILILLILQFVLTVFISVIGKVEKYLTTLIQTNIEQHLKENLAKKLFKINYEKLEDFEFQNLLQRVQGDIGAQVFQPILQILELISTLITVITLIVFLVQFHWIFVFLIFAFSIPVLIIQSKFGADRYFLFKYQTPYAREQYYIFDMFMDRQHNKEIRISQSDSYLISRWAKVFQKNKSEVLNQEKSQQKMSVGLDVLSGLSYLICSLYLVWMITNKSVQIGDFVSLVEAVQRLQGSLVMIAILFAAVREKSFYLNDFKSLIQPTEESKNLNPINLFEGLKDKIHIKNLNFSYPNTDRMILKDINLEIPKHSSLVIVGENGSGKSTLIKCLSSLYPVPEGTVFYDDLDIQYIDKSSLYDKLAVVHQDFVKYEFTVEENIKLGDMKNIHQSDDIVDILSKIEADKFINSLPRKLDTRLGKMFEESIELSGGQWQKISLARAVLKKSDIIILDEPTSALDPETEINIFMAFKELAKEKTSIFISHRMYSCHLADQIVVMKEGRIVEIGGFQELLEMRGEFFKLYDKQANMYNFKNEVTT